MNARKLKIREITLDQDYGTTNYHSDPENEIIQVSYNDGNYIDPGEHVLNIKYTGMFGYFLGFYKLDPSQSHGK